jgi:hypothetical protein
VDDIAGPLRWVGNAITAARAIPLLSASERAAFTGTLAELERIEAIWLPRVGKDPWTTGQYVQELDSVMQHADVMLLRHRGASQARDWRTGQQ